MGIVRCQFCHKYFDDRLIEAHYEQHRKLLPDGQMTDYVTIPPEGRYSGSLEDVPKWYHHEVCGAVTGMPEEIIRSYLVDPFLYSADRTFCSGCGEHVPLGECTWTETEEDLQTYTDHLRDQARQRWPVWKRILSRFKK